MMESTPSLVNWHPVNKLPKPKMQTLTAIQAIAYGADSVQYFQWRKSRGSHEKFHGAVVDHCGNENTRVFREVATTGAELEKLDNIVGAYCNSKVAVICDWDNSRAVRHFCGYNNKRRDYYSECIKWYKPFWEMGISTDVISMDDDFSKYDLVIAPFLYMLQDDTESKIEQYVRNGGNFVMTYLSAVVDKNDLCYLGGLPANNLKNVFGVWAEETDSLPDNMKGKATFNGKEYEINHICDIIHSKGAKILGEYKSDFYSDMPSVTENEYGSGKAYYVAFRNDSDLAKDFCTWIVREKNIPFDAEISVPYGVSFRKRGDSIFVMNFNNEDKEITTQNGSEMLIPANDFIVLYFN